MGEADKRAGRAKRPSRRIGRLFTMASIVAIGTVFAGIAPASAEPATSSSATAIGVEGSGLLPIPATPTITASQPPDSGERRQTIINLSVPPLAVVASGTVVAEASQESQVPTPIFPELMENALRRHVGEAKANARSFSRVDGLGIGPNGSQDAGAGSLAATLLSATSIETTAIARCVDNQALFDTDYNIAGLKVLGQDLPLDGLLAPLLAGLDLGTLISVKAGEAGPLPGGGVFINGLHVSIAALNVDLIVGRSEARMPTPCGAGDEPNAAAVAPVAQLSSSPASVSAPVAGELAQSGGPTGLLPAGIAMAAAGAALGHVNRRLREERRG